MIKYRKTNHPKWRWELEEDYTIIHDKSIEPTTTDYIIVGVIASGRFEHPYITLKQGYAINGVNLLPDRKVWMRAAFVHDALWQLIQLGKLPKSMVGVSNRIFRDIIAEDDNAITAWLMYTGVQLGGFWRFKLKPSIKKLFKF